MEANRSADRSVVYLEGERDSRAVGFGALHERALGILYRLQRLGRDTGDKLILLLSGNEPFIDAFWAAVLGGIIPVPVAPGISDEHRHKLLRIARKLGTRLYLYRAAPARAHRGVRRRAAAVRTVRVAARACASWSTSSRRSRRSGKLYRARPADMAFIQFSSGSTSEPKGVVLTHANLMANIRGVTAAAKLQPGRCRLSWMPLTHDMGLIGFHLMMFANRMHSHLMPTELFVRRPLLWLQLASEMRAEILCSPNFGYRHYLKVLGERALERARSFELCG